MKKKIYIPFLLMLFLGLSCAVETEDALHGNQAKENLIRIGINPKGEITVSEHPLKAGELENADLFALQFFEAGTNKPYAHVVGDDISKIEVDFHKDREYKVKMTYLKNGKNIIHSWENGNKWGTPFTTYFTGTKINRVYYSSATAITEISSAQIHSTNEALSVGRYVEVDRYHGVVEVFKATKETTVLDIDLKRMVFGVDLKIELLDADVNVIRFSINYRNQHQQEYFVDLIEGKGNLKISFVSLGFPDYYFTSDDHLDYGVADDYKEGVHISLGTEENYTKLFDGAVEIKRNVLATMNFKQQETEDYTEGKVDLILEEGELEEIEVMLPTDN